MNISPKADDYETISDSKQVVLTPKSAPTNFQRIKLMKRLSLLDHLDDPPKLWKESSSSLVKIPSFRIGKDLPPIKYPMPPGFFPKGRRK
jgi:hypothetical protein